MSGHLLQQYLDETVERRPDKVALIDENNRLDYRSLWEKSNCLAGRLDGLGFKPQQTAGIVLEKSIEAVIAQFALLRIGGIYIPLDPCYVPLSRARKIIALSETRFLISRTGLWNKLVSAVPDDERPWINGLTVLLVDTLINEKDEHELPRKSVWTAGCRSYDRSASPVRHTQYAGAADDVAYILYTSGSTGVPKGVMITHRNAMTFINWALSCFRPSDKDVFSGIAPLSFDLSVFDLYVSIACGASLHLASAQTVAHPRALLSWLENRGITYLYTVPSLLVTLMNHTALKHGDLPRLSHILFAGEVFPPTYLKKLMLLLPHASYYNLYGPTETNVCTCHQVKHPDEIRDRPVPIGSACADAEVIAVKETGEPAAVGEEGELFVKGACVAKGYYKNAELTKVVFQKDPQARQEQASVCRTGDIVRRIGPCLYEYVGRKDLMVKCLGFRIELQEIENALLRHPSIQEAVVVPVFKDDPAQVTSLAAFITLKKGFPFEVVPLKHFLAAVVPKYMIPESFRHIDAMPKNVHGKIDRKLLADMYGGMVNGEEET